jgi:putative aldouronate transport system substrate-binding protein
MTKRWLLKASVLLTIAMLVLSACVSPAQETQPAATNQPAATSQPAATTGAAAAATESPTQAAGGGWRTTDAYSPFPEKLTLSLVKGGQENASLLPQGESIEDNRALQYIEDTLNIDITYEWIVPSDSYGDKLNLTISSGEIPDAMIVTPIQLQQLVEAGVLEDMTPYIEKYANEDILENYSQTEGVAIDTATIDGKVWGVPNVQPQADAP